MALNETQKRHPASPPVVLFDGVCKLCNASVNLILQRDRKGKIKFAPLQSDYGQARLKEFGKGSEILDSIIFLEGDRLTAKSTAALRITKYLDGLWPLCTIFLIIPRFIRDFFYDVIAKNRYRWFGKCDTCRLPGPGYEDRFFT